MTNMHDNYFYAMCRVDSYMDMIGSLIAEGRSSFSVN